MTRYDKRQIKTADVKVGDIIYFPGSGFELPIAKIERQDDIVWFYGIYERWGRRRYASVQRRASGKTTVHIPVPAEVA